MYITVEMVGYLCKYFPAGPQSNSTWSILQNVVVAQFERRNAKKNQFLPSIHLLLISIQDGQ